MSNYKLSDICKIRYGKDHKSLDNGNIPVYGTGGIMRYVDSTLYEKESVLIPRKGTLSNLFYVDEPFWTIDTLFYTEIDKSKVLPKYLYFKLKTIDLAGMNVGTAVPSLTTALLNEIELNIPALENQIKIVDILSSLENKIENNNAIIANLEEQAQTIFKSWFVDFEPFQDVEFVESELGLIPLGWDVSTLDKLAQINMGQSPKSEYYNTIGEGYPFMQGNTTFGVKFGTIEKYTEQSNRISNYKDILLSVRAPVGDMNINIINNLAIGRGLTSIKPQKNLHGYVYSYLKHFLNRIIAKGTGTVFSSINKKDLTSFHILLPKDEKLLSVFVEMSNNFLDQQICLELENRKLTETRDILLPKLMSGEIRVEDTIEVKEM